MDGIRDDFSFYIIRWSNYEVEFNSKGDYKTPYAKLVLKLWRKYLKKNSAQ